MTAICTKIDYLTQAVADQEAVFMKRKLGADLESYHCPRCRHWHLKTSKLEDVRVVQVQYVVLPRKKA